jgi:hypothetical protein
MPIESSTTIANLDQTWPLGGDPLNGGDDHLRLIKAVLKAQFPGVGAQGFAVPIAATEDEINYLSGVSSNVQGQLNAISSDDSLIAPSGTVMLFYQASPPVGWTQVPTHDNKMLRVVSASGGGSGGTDSPIAFDFSHVHTTALHALTVAEMPSHNHSWTSDKTNDEYGGGAGVSRSTITGNQGTITTTSQGSGAAHEHGDTGGGDLAFTPLYIDTILASKD